jgi:hypothetical protein
MSVLPFALFVGLWILLSRRMPTGSSGLGKFGRSEARRARTTASTDPSSSDA